MDEELHRQLGEWLLADARPEPAREEFAAWLALDPLDRSAAQYGLARAYRDLGRLADAKLQVLEALERAPRFRPAQRLLLELRRRGQTSKRSAQRAAGKRRRPPLRRSRREGESQ
jgi:hypothetical protein